ncbi:MAG: 50S ribosomal protein L9 [Treponema sp.]|nr:50S ribosomal protein L9 [Treponema sp.]
MKVILNKDVNHLGEEGDVKMVADGYARNYLFPRSLALPYTPEVVAIFEGRKAEIEARKAQKREAAKSDKEKLEALALSITVPASAGGKLYGAVSAQTVIELLAKEGFDFERKRVEIPGNTIKQTGTYKINVKLYENAVAEIHLEVKGQVDESKKEPERKPRAKKEAEAEKPAESAEAPAEEKPAEAAN